MSDYPEHDKMLAVKDKSQAIGEFIDLYLPELGLVLAQWDDNELVPAHRSIEKILAELFDIDLEKIEAEKRAMLASLRKADG